MLNIEERWGGSILVTCLAHNWQRWLIYKYRTRTLTFPTKRERDLTGIHILNLNFSLQREMWLIYKIRIFPIDRQIWQKHKVEFDFPNREMRQIYRTKRCTQQRLTLASMMSGMAGKKSSTIHLYRSRSHLTLLSFSNSARPSQSSMSTQIRCHRTFGFRGCLGNGKRSLFSAIGNAFSIPSLKKSIINN